MSKPRDERSRQLILVSLRSDARGLTLSDLSQPAIVGKRFSTGQLWKHVDELLKEGTIRSHKTRRTRNGPLVETYFASEGAHP